MQCSHNSLSQLHIEKSSLSQGYLQCGPQDTMRVDGARRRWTAQAAAELAQKMKDPRTGGPDTQQARESPVTTHGRSERRLPETRTAPWAESSLKPNGTSDLQVRHCCTENLHLRTRNRTRFIGPVRDSNTNGLLIANEVVRESSAPRTMLLLVLLCLLASAPVVIEVVSETSRSTCFGELAKFHGAR